MKINRTIIVPSAIVVLWAGVIGTSFGQTFWTAGTGNWNTAANWTLGVPNAGSPTAFDAVIENGGTAQLTGAPSGSVRRLRVGRAAGAGNVLVDGVALNVTENLHLNEGAGGVASTTVQNGGTVTSPSTVIAHTGANTSNFTVTGTNSVLNSSALTVGLGGTGVLNIQSNGTVTSNSLSINGTSNVNLNNGTLRFASASGLNRINYTAGTIQLPDTFDVVTDGRVTGLFGSLPVIPANKTLRFEGQLGIRNHSLIVDGGTLISGSMITGDLFDQSGGGMSVVNGGKVTTTGTVSLGNNPDATSTDILVRGFGSSWHIGAGAHLGYSTITIQDQGLVHFAGDLFTTIDGEINVQGGTLRLNTVSGSGVGQIVFNAGTIQLAGNRTTGFFADAAINQFFGTSPVITQFRNLTIEGTATLNSFVTVDGGAFSVGQLVNASMLDFRRGTLSFTNQVLTIAPSGPLGDTLDLPADKTVNSTLGISNQGLVTGEGRVGEGIFTNTASGELRVEAGRTFTLAGTGNTNAGRIYLQDGTLDFHQSLTNQSTGQIMGRGTLVTGGITNQGHIALSSGITDVFGDVSNNTASATRGITVSGNADVTFWDDVTNTGVSLFRVAAGSSATFFGGFSGSGISGTGTVYFESDITPGASPASIDFGGDVVFGSGVSLEIEIGGLAAGTQHDKVNIAGDVALDGVLAISFINGFTPSVGQTFNILDWLGTRMGTFDAVQLPALAGLSWDTSQLYSGGMVAVAPGLSGDYNNDGVVDAADYVMWRKLNGTSTMMPNDPNPVPIDNDQYLTWRGNFGAIGGGGSVVVGTDLARSTIPEPDTLALLLLAAVIVVFGELRWRYIPCVQRPLPSTCCVCN